MREEKILRKKGTSRVDDLFFGWRGQPNAGCWLVCGGGSAILCEKYGQVVLNKPLMILFLDGPKCQSLHVPSEKKQSVSTIKTPYASSSSTKYMLVVRYTRLYISSNGLLYNIQSHHEYRKDKYICSQEVWWWCCVGAKYGPNVLRAHILWYIHSCEYLFRRHVVMDFCTKPFHWQHFQNPI